MKRFVVFTDLDGTLLDHHTYSVRRALPALDLLVRREMPIVPVSSKTSAEVRLWMRHLFLTGPYIYENGCGIRVPKDYFRAPLDGEVEQGDELRMNLGPCIGEIRADLDRIAEKLNIGIRGLGDMEYEEVVDLTGLRGEELNLCLKREHDEAFVIDGDFEIRTLREETHKAGLKLLRGGRFYHLTGGCDKGMAVKILADRFRSENPGIVTVGIGDSENDMTMLTSVERPFLVRRPDGSYDPAIPENAVSRVDGIGPLGWRMAVEEVMAGV